MSVKAKSQPTLCLWLCAKNLEGTIISLGPNAAFEMCARFPDTVSKQYPEAERWIFLRAGLH